MAELYALLTGGHTGIGFEVTKLLLKPGNKVGLIIRSESRKQQIMSAFSAFAPELVDGINFFYADLSDQAQVRTVAQTIKTSWPRIDVLFNNAGVAGPGMGRSKQGNEMHLEINTLSHYLLTTGLEPLLRGDGGATVVTTVTGGMHNRKLKTDPFFDDARKGGAMTTFYPQSKQAIMLLLNDLASSWPEVRFLSVNPGANKTPMSTGPDAPLFIRTLANLFFSEASVGGKKLYAAAFDMQFAHVNAAFIQNGKIQPIKHGLTAADKTTLLSAIQT